MAAARAMCGPVATSQELRTAFTTPLSYQSPFPQVLHLPKPLQPFSWASLHLKSNPSPTISASAFAVFEGSCYVVGDNIDTDQIIPAEHLTLVPSNPDEYRKLGSLALSGLPSQGNPVPFVAPGSEVTRFPVIVAGANFGCGSSREHAPVALGAAGARVVVAESYARIFFRTAVATGEVYPVEFEEAGACRECAVGDHVVVDLDGNKLVNRTTGKEYKLKPIGDAGPVVEAGGIFAYAYQTGMILSSEASD